MSLGSVCVFAGSKPGARPGYLETAQALGRALARRGIGLVYGGARCGLMGAMADAALAGGGRVVGVMPQGLVDLEVAHRGLSELIITDDMHARKARMAGLADAFVALPGGYGTLEELFEVVTWAQLGLHRKPVGLLDSEGFWTGLQAFLAHTRAEGFIPDSGLAVLPCAADPDRILDLLAAGAGTRQQ
ncbi:MAG: TIGR00730 family Rossman fold protein [Holophaga sp.]|nr:TIGR00730 family Rossman fold protein [Holophaga sp.]